MATILSSIIATSVAGMLQAPQSSLKTTFCPLNYFPMQGRVCWAGSPLPSGVVWNVVHVSACEGLRGPWFQENAHLLDFGCLYIPKAFAGRDLLFSLLTAFCSFLGNLVCSPGLTNFRKVYNCLHKKRDLPR